MESKKSCSVTLVTCHKSKFPHMLGFEQTTSAYVTGIPPLLTLEKSTSFLITDDIISNLLPFEVEKMFEDVKSLVIAALRNKKNSDLIIIGPMKILMEIDTHLKTPSPVPIEYSIFDSAIEKDKNVKA